MRETLRTLSFALVVAGALALLSAASALASFGFEDYDFRIENGDGTPATQAGSHPFAMTTKIDFNSLVDPLLGEVPDGQPKDVVVTLPQGLVGELGAVPRCSNADFLAIPEPQIEHAVYTSCPDSTAVGVARLQIGENGHGTFFAAVYNLEPSPGEVQRLGLIALSGVPVTIDITVSEKAPYNVIATVSGISQQTRFYGSELTIWGDPANPGHDSERGHCVAPTGFPSSSGNISRGNCPAGVTEKPLLTLPSSCSGPLPETIEADSWQSPGAWVKGVAFTHDQSSPPVPLGLSGCGELGFSPTISAQLTKTGGQEPTGLDFGLDVNDEGLGSAEGTAAADVRKVEVSLPEGFTANPSLATGLKACSLADLARETSSSAPGAGCPQEAKIGTVEVQTPLLEEPLHGSIFVAEPFENEASNSLIALYVVIKSAKLGISIKQPIRVQLDPTTGRLTAVAEEVPQFPFSHFTMHLRDGARAALTAPASCGSYTASAVLTPSSGGSPVSTSSMFQILTGPAGGPCPSGAGKPFSPTFQAGTLSPVAGAYSPFVLSLRREEGSQQLGSLTTTLPPGLAGKLAGVTKCSDAQIAAAAARSAPRQGQLELAGPSCPPDSEVGAVRAGAGSGDPTYVTGHAYLAGAYEGAPLSLAIVTPAVTGPFDLGVVLVRVALYVDPATAQIRAVSDPLPRILDGIPLDIRSITVDMDRPQFTFNPTSCEPMSVGASIAGVQPDDSPGATVAASSRFQVGECASLAFKPRFSASTAGRTSRKDGASLDVKLTYPSGSFGTQANIASVRVELPKALPSRLSTLNHACTDAVFEQDPAGCPTESRVGYAKAITPVLPVPLEGPAYFVSHGGQKFPELVMVLQGYGITIDLRGETFISKAGITSSTFKQVPDVPVSSFELTLPQGPFSALAANVNLCNLTRTVLVKKKVTVNSHGHKRKITRTLKQTVPGNLTMPTHFTSQNGTTLTQSTSIDVTGCPKHVRHVRKKTHLKGK